MLFSPSFSAPSPRRRWRSLSFAVCLSALAPIAVARASAADPAADPAAAEKNWIFLANAELRLGLLRSHGGAIGHLSAAGSDFNVLNHYDHGRLVQQSYYGDTDGSRWAEKPWRYNPVQGGDYRGRPAKVRELQSTETTAYVKTIPRHWASGELLSECTMEQWVELQGPLVFIRYRFVYRGAKHHKKRHQETPAVFVSPKLTTLVRYQGEQPWTDGPLVRTIPGWPNEPARLGEHWAAYVDQHDQGVGIYVPGVSEATCYRYRGGADSNCSYVAPLRRFALTPGLDFSYHAYLTVGDVKIIRARFRNLHKAER